MENAPESRTVRLAVFGGAHADFQVWRTRFMAFAAVCKIMQALKIGGETNMPAEEDAPIGTSADAAGGKLVQNAAVQRNVIAMANLMMTFTNEAAITLVHEVMTVEWATGLAHSAVAALFKKCRPQCAMTRVELRKVLNAIKMKKGKDPATLFEQTCSVKKQVQHCDKENQC
jgi:hypothetical protein